MRTDLMTKSPTPMPSFEGGFFAPDVQAITDVDMLYDPEDDFEDIVIYINRAGGYRDE